MSRYHCEISRRNGGIWVSDLGSINGISVNGERTAEGRISDGDELKVGLVSFRVTTVSKPANEPADPSPPVELSRMLTATLNPWKPSWTSRAPEDRTRAESDLVVLLELCRALQARLPVEEIAQRLLDQLQRALPFGCGAVSLVDVGSSRASEIIKLPANHDVEIDPSVDLGGQPHLGPERIIAPLIVNQTHLGTLLVTSDGRNEFDAEHHQLATAAAAATAAAIDNARREQRLALRLALLEQERSSSAELAGDSPQAQSIRRGIEALGASAAPGLILGPAGIGKDAAARAIHAKSLFSEGPLIFARCLGHPQDQLERLLFGVESDNQSRRGWIDQAAGGTICLERVDGLGPQLQQRVRAVIELGEYSRHGGSAAFPVRCRILASAPEGLEKDVATGAFSGELFNALRGLTVTMPGLRTRPSDLPAIAQIMAAELSERAGRPLDGISNAALVALTLYGWPDNVRELESVIRSAELRRTTNYIELEDLPDEVAETVNPEAAGGYHHEVREARRQIILAAFESARGNHNSAAELLRINRTYLHRLIRNLELKDELNRRFGKS